MACSECVRLFPEPPPPKVPSVAPFPGQTKVGCKEHRVGRELAGLCPGSALLPWASVGVPGKGHQRVQLG